MYVNWGSVVLLSIMLQWTGLCSVIRCWVCSLCYSILQCTKTQYFHKKILWWVVLSCLMLWYVRLCYVVADSIFVYVYIYRQTASSFLIMSTLYCSGYRDLSWTTSYPACSCVILCQLALRLRSVHDHTSHHIDRYGALRPRACCHHPCKQYVVNVSLIYYVAIFLHTSGVHCLKC